VLTSNGVEKDTSTANAIHLVKLPVYYTPLQL